MASPLIRPLERRDWSALRDLRLLALRTTPGVFYVAHEAAATRQDEEWQKATGGAGHQAFGLFDDDRLVGITGVGTSSDDPSGATAVLVMSFLLPEYRGRGLSRSFYAARLEWIRGQSQFSRIVVSHRASNEASRRANQRHGFHFVRRAPHTWPDGVTEDELFYEMDLRKNGV